MWPRLFQRHDREVRHFLAREVHHAMPVKSWDAAFRPFLDRLHIQLEGAGQIGAAPGGSDDFGVKAHTPDVGGNMPPRQAETCSQPWGLSPPHNAGMSKQARPAAYSVVAKEIGQRIRWARELVEPNRAEFARGLGVDRSTIRDIESGRRPPSVFAVLAISHQLRVTPDYILTAKMRDVDGELAAALGAHHPELLSGATSAGIQRMVPEASTDPKPKKPQRRVKKG